jgi:hypothetical protein
MPKPPEGWASGDYYYNGKSSYGVTAGKRGGRLTVTDDQGNTVKSQTFLEKMTCKEKYEFIKEHNHAFAAAVGIPYFNPYGKVPLDEKLTKIIPKPREKRAVHELIGQRLDYDEYLEARVSTDIPYACGINNLFAGNRSGGSYQQSPPECRCRRGKIPNLVALWPIQSQGRF